jgi:hypothetical protein
MTTTTIEQRKRENGMKQLQKERAENLSIFFVAKKFFVPGLILFNFFNFSR